jgi:hypothetical protein
MKYRQCQEPTCKLTQAVACNAWRRMILTIFYVLSRSANHRPLMGSLVC